jgi:hypothetical protein
MERYCGAGARPALLKLEARINAAETVHSGPELIDSYARIRVTRTRIGHPCPARP